MEHRAPLIRLVFLLILVGLIASLSPGVLADGLEAGAQPQVTIAAVEQHYEAAPLAQPTVRLKDIARFDGVRENQLTGLGLVVGLDGTGDSRGLSIRMVTNMLTRFGVDIDPADMRTRNVAAVMVTANLPAFARAGDRLDVTVSSIGDAKSLQGGFLLQTPLRGADNQVYAVAQGPLSIGGFNVRGGGSQSQSNHPTIARGPGIAIVEREIWGEALPIEDGQLNLVLHSGDFTTAYRTAEEINKRFGSDTAYARDSTSVTLNIPAAYRQNVIGFLAEVEEIEVAPDTAGRVVINERTGTVVIGQSVRVATVAVAHGNLKVSISEEARVSQPPPFSNGETVVTTATTLEVEEEGGQLMVLPGTATIGDLVNVLNTVGATPRDIIAILQAIKEAGALYGELEII
ncbi:MAG: flagellar basal body P-ring protein FlgI [Firmicutes bacterium]|jgi:flagellar P-ring protein precursor FlgI|nr:flagellar basal body P-ring protein FlgI [Bacillota bacterium]